MIILIPEKDFFIQKYYVNNEVIDRIDYTVHIKVNNLQY